MSDILSIGARAMMTAQVALQTTGNNIANVNTPGYSRQSVALETVPGQFTGNGYIGKGVDIRTIERSFSAFLTRQSALAGSTQASDAARADKLKQLEGVFDTGSNGLGAAISDMMNAFSDVATAPTDLTARTVVLTRAQETAARMRAASARLDDLQAGVGEELKQKITNINSLAGDIAAVNGEISRAQGSGQTPNDLLDRRDQLIRELNKLVQTSQIPADDGSIGIFIAGSQALVLGSSVSPVSLVQDDFGDNLKTKLAITRGGKVIALDENALGGGEVSGLLRFQNTDLMEGRNLLGRMTLAITTTLNNQHHMGLDMNGNPGGDLFSPITFNAYNVLQPVQLPAPAPTVAVNTGTAALTMGVSNATQFVASDYQVTFSTATAGTITRLSDGVVTSFDFALTNPVVIDGLSLTESGAAAAGDRFLLKPFATSANTIAVQFSTPRALAMASPIAAAFSAANKGGVQLESLVAQQPNANLTSGVTLTFTGPGTYNVTGTGAGIPAIGLTYTPGQPITFNGWSLTLRGSPQAGDVVSVGANAYPQLSAGNATAMMQLRDIPMFDGAAMSDGYAGLISQVGIRSQSASYAAKVSETIATNVEKDRTSVSGVNLDEEAAKLLQYQQAYQASAKVVQIAQSIFDTLMQDLLR